MAKEQDYSSTFNTSRTEAGNTRRTLRETTQVFMSNLTNLSQVQQALQKELSSSRDTAKISSLSGQLQQLESEKDQLKGTLTDLESTLGDRIQDILRELDPRRQVENLDDQFPVFLMPVRVEVRFMTVKHIARLEEAQLPQRFAGSPPLPANQRVVPISEIYNGFSELPVIEDVDELWIRIFPDDIAINTHEKALTPAEIEAGKIFWQNMWAAFDEAAEEIGAWRGLVSGRSPERSAWIAREMTPTNPQDKPTDPDAPIVDPVFPEPLQKPDSWTEMPVSRVMPDKFVVRLYNGSAFREVVGNRVPDPLPVSFDPIDPTAGLNNADGKLELPDKLRWVQDFEEAEKVGMGIRVPLYGQERMGFTRMLVLGVKASADEVEGKELIEELFDNHHFTSGSISILPQGTPTNNTEQGGSGYAGDNSDDESLFDIELGPGQFTESSVDHEKSDGQRLGEALGIDFEVLQHIKHAGMTDISEAMCMNRALWPTTLGYYLSQIMHPVFTKVDIQYTRNHFNQYVLGRGRIPAIRVDEQPYGILPTTAFSQWTYPQNDGQSGFLNRMHNNVLLKMEDTWQQLSTLVKHADQSFTAAQTDKAFLDILGLHASSVEFYQRYISGPYFIWNIFAYSSLLNSQTVPPNQNKASYVTSLDFLNLFQNLNYIFAYPPRCFDFIHATKEKYLDGPVVDPFPLSETRGLQAIGSNEETYIHWLRQSSFRTIQAENFANIGAAGITPPNSLLYLMLRHACLLEYVDTGLNILVNQKILSADAYLEPELININQLTTISPTIQNLVQARVISQEAATLNSEISEKADQEFVRRAEEGALEGFNFKEIEAQKATFKKDLKAEAEPEFQAKVDSIVKNELAGLKLTASKTGALYESYPFLQAELTLADWIENGINAPQIDTDLQEMADLKAALGCLENIPTARLERLFAEHVDLAGYRLDAWFTSLVAQRLDNLRNPGGGQRQTGLYVGSYAWLENVKPGTFRGIAYREIEIAGNDIVIPGITDAVAGPQLDIPGRILGKPLPGIGSLDGGRTRVAPATGSVAAPLAEASPVKANVFAAEVDMTQVSALLPSGDLRFQLDQGIRSLLVDAPLTPGLPEKLQLQLSPSYSYLGTGDPGSVMYDPILDKFIHRPRIDTSNQGYIHAPSVNQAMTAAVLRAGYESHKTNPGSADDTFAINLSSERIRRAMFFLEGIRNGQELSALLGYQFERALHDKEANLDQYIFDIRLKYALVAGRVTDTSGATTINDAEAYNVVDGLRLMEEYRDNPVGWATGITFSNAQHRTIIEAEIDRMADSMDAIHDLLLAESVHQTVQGNTARSRAALNAISGDGVPPEPELITTPRSFDAVTLRKAIVFDQANGAVRWTGNGTPRSIAEPGLNSMLANLLPAPDKIGVSIRFRYLFADGSPGSEESEKVLLDVLGLEAIDLFYILTTQKDQGQSAELDERLALAMQEKYAEAAIEVVAIQYDDRAEFLGDERSIKELAALIKSLQQLIKDAKPLDARDFLLAGEADAIMTANPGAGFDLAELEARLTDILGATMSNGQPGLAGVKINLDAGIGAAESALGGGLLGFDTVLVNNLVNGMMNGAAFGIEGSIPHLAGNLTESLISDLLDQAHRVSTLLGTQADQANALLAEVPGITDPTPKLRKLEAVAQAVFGRQYKVIPSFTHYDVATFDQARAYPDYLLHAGDMAIEEWLQSLAPVRKRIRHFQRVNLLAQSLTGGSQVFDPHIIQLPLAPLDGGGNVQARWLGMQLPPDYEIPEENLSIVIHLPSGYNSANTQAGLIVDEWIDEIPLRDADTGLSVHFDNPNSEPPNACLLAVSPDLNGKWEWDHLMATLDETLDWAKKRAVDPDLLNQTPYAQILPAIMAAIAGTDEIPTLDFGRNVLPKPTAGIFDMIKLKEFTKIIQS
ncbi:MAG: hypothetical protein AAFV07_00365 [Bacteroidota bacterium]